MASLARSLRLAALWVALAAPLTATARTDRLGGSASLANCTEIVFVEQPVDHFNGGSATFSQRVCIHDGFRRPGDGEHSPVFFYTGNEGPVDLYVNNTGIMWTLGETLGAVLVFAEHRYFGESYPKLDGMENCMAYVSSAQALADYAAVVPFVKNRLGLDHFHSKVIAFGGSYGGMLAAYFRLRYPHVCNGGAVAGSAPVLGFASSRPDLDGAYLAISQGLEDASGQADPQCWDSFLAAWTLISLLAESSGGRALLETELGWCSPLPPVSELLSTLQDVLFLLAESNFPYPSDYIVFATINKRGYKLPAWPMREVCAHVRQPQTRVSLSGNRSDVRFTVDLHEDPKVQIEVDWDAARTTDARELSSLSSVRDLVRGVGKMYGMLYNITGDVECFSATSDEEVPSLAKLKKEEEAHGKSTCSVDAKSVGMLDAWGALVCNEGFFLVQYLLRGLGRDMYWPPSVSRSSLANSSYEELVLAARAEASCSSYRERGLYGVTDDPATLDPLGRWPFAQYMGREISQYGSKIIFSNGRYDPWSAAGVLESQSDRGIEAVEFAHGAHHTDFMFPTAQDPPSLREGRAREERIIRSWLVSGQGNAIPASQV
ncbi:Lysosomal Pro-X carboxypeptidase [Hondaea fermentalgiana]|uniref:Lysosomal Pro-X carboxypeptidase n=1 Tax=Hondaea fermentalgiana TaxID=2315210 RepID=A0A2R5GK95_9STRA|nr:Lysosomal Pro-X carboxypeptidase [Hondaea fermentalgiana]|eukprot:GBG30148.1 Lysosomal Pro-X carboxypeptidase [Hondaea fermentalgiana]